MRGECGVWSMLVVWSTLMCGSLPRPVELRFTRTFYNVTIPENSVSRTLVTTNQPMAVFRHSTDEHVTFRIISGDPDRIFKVEDKEVGDFIFLVLRTRGGNSVVLNRERKDKFVLTVKAYSTRSTIEATTIIYVRVLDQNDLSPIFVRSEYNRTIPEDFNMYRNILKVSAEDADLGVGGEIFYSIKEPSGYFSVHPFTGEISLSKLLKYSERSIHDLIIVAQDRATIFRGGGQVTLAKATIKVKQVNLHGPEIYVYVLQEPSAHKLGLVYAVVRVVDRDEGIHGQIGDISIVSGDDEGHFIIYPVDENKNNSRNEYNIIMTNNLFPKQQSLIYNMSLRVTDKGFPQRMAYKAISILVQYDSERDPFFERELYEIDVPEYLPQGSPLLRLNIRNSDVALPNEISLRIIDGDVGNAFYISSKNYILYTDSLLDAESQRSYTLSVKLQFRDREDQRRPIVTKIKINVLDCNDNNPAFNELPEEIWVNENQPAGTHVVKISASDPDSGQNGFITYSIVNIRNVPFEIDPLSGILRTTQPLDFETMKRDYLLTVQVSDSGQPFRRQSQSQMVVQIRNLNDNTPVFLKGECSVSIPVRLKSGSHLLTITALDLDEMDVISYSLLSSVSNDCIRVHPSSGKLTLQCDLLNVLEKEWLVNVTATDGVFKTKTTLKIFIASSGTLDQNLKRVQYSCRDIEFYKNTLEPEITRDFVNDDNGESIDFELVTVQDGDNAHEPELHNNPELLVISESQALNDEIHRVNAFDKDYGYNGKLVYEIANQKIGSVFKIDPDNGTIVLLAPPKLTEISTSSLNLTVCDQGKIKRCSSAVLYVKVLEDDSFNLKFRYYKSHVHVTESKKIGAEIFKIEVNDRLSVTYHLMCGSSFFNIDEQTGSVTIKDPLDREATDIIKLCIQARKDNVVKTRIDAYITVVVDDENDNAPSFVNTEYTVHVREDIPPGSIVYVVNAIDSDLGNNGIVTYSLLDVEKFTIDATSGAVRLKGHLDFETKSEHRIVVQARDQGKIPLTSQVTLTIVVSDVNENLHPPVFDDVVIVVNVVESSPLGTLVTTVTATDADLAADDSRITYSLKEGDGLGIFNITEQGSIYTCVQLDAEMKNSYWLTVVAEDKGSVPLSGSVQVYIEVVDVNDNLPLTTEAFYHFHVEENLPSHTAVGQVTGSDGDLSSTPCKFHLSPHPGLPFSIDANTGYITTTTLLDREEMEEYIFYVIVSDQEKPVLSSSTQVRVSVLDVNDHTPSFLQDHYSVRLPQIPRPLLQGYDEAGVEDEMEEGDGAAERLKWSTSHSLSAVTDTLPLLQVLAVDLDEGHNASVFYSVESGSPFVIHPETGQIYTRSRLMPGREYEIMVRASDRGRPSRSSTCRVTFHTLHKQHILKKIPASQSISVTVHENIAPGDAVIKLNSPVNDKNQLFFVISGGNGTTHFAMQGDSLVGGRRLDFENVAIFHVTVTASNHSATWIIQVLIRVIGSNKYSPRFEQELYSLSVSEDLPLGSILVSLFAKDLDPNSTLVYDIVNFQPGSNMFAVDPVFGDLILNSPLDRETSSSHLLTVRVSDTGPTPRSGFARIHIQVLDINDNYPIWPKPTLFFRISDTSPIGSVIGKLVATDLDSGTNGTLKYKIISGNNAQRPTFTVHEDEGTLSLTGPVDAWDTDRHVLTVLAQDAGDKITLDSTVTVEVTVFPSEKKTPRCQKKHPWLEVSERARVGEVVGHVSVSHIPSLHYQLTDPDSQQAFIINPCTGDVIVQQSLDYEETTLYNFSVSVTTLAGLSIDCQVVVYVLDYNDNPPILREELYSGYILESASPGSLIMTDHGPLVITAEDQDSGINGLMQFHIQGTKGESFLSVDPITGTVRTVKALDFESFQEIEVKVSVSDWGSPRLSSEVQSTLRVQIIDVNDSPPVFSQQIYNVTLSLPHHKDTLILQVKATDKDSEEISVLVYSVVVGNEDLALRIDERSGEICIQEPEKLRPRQLTVRVYDGVYDDLALVNIYTHQQEHHSLKFQKAVYEGAVLENSTKISVVAVVDVTGSRLNEVIRFSILNPSPHFIIGNTSGVITTVGYLFDREERDFYQLRVQAHSFNRQQEALTTVNISVLDANDNCPQFMNLPYRATISINSTKGDFVFKVHAKDADHGENGEVRYELDQTGLENFRIGRKSGEIKLKVMSLSKKSDINVIVTANDGGIVPCSASAVLVISVIDSRAPLWERTVYRAQIQESAPIFTTIPVVLKAAAINKPLYQLPSSDTFLLRHDSGVLQVYDTLDRETDDSFSLTVRATDAVSRLHSETLLLLDILDVNDCYPQFLQDSYDVRIPEDADIGSVILRVEAIDNDSGMNAIIRYSAAHPVFSVNSEEGTVILKQRLDFESIRQHRITVTATDAGLPPLSSFAVVIVNVVNVNDNAPNIRNWNAIFQVSQDAMRGGFVGRVMAEDADGDDLTYKLISRQLHVLHTFHLDAQTGIISILNPSGLSPRNIVQLNVSVDDGVHLTTGLLAVKVLPTNRYKPVFELKQYTALIRENSPAGHPLIKVTATDKDDGLFANVTYFLPVQSSSIYFTIDSVTGNITSLVPLDREKMSELTIDVRASDGGGLQDWTTVHVKVIDVNDNKPRFLLPRYSACVPSNISAHYRILTVEAEDGDEHKAGRVKYSIVRVEPARAREWFHMEAREGALHAYPALISQQDPQEVKMLVRASDEGVPPLSTEVSVKLIITSEDAGLDPLRYVPSFISIPTNAKPGFSLYKFRTKVNDIHLVGEDDSIVLNSSGHLLLKRLPKFSKQSVGVFISSSQKPFSLCFSKTVRLVKQLLPPLLPEFVEDSVKVSVPENVPIGYSLYRVAIRSKSTAYFKMAEETDIFSVDPLTGWITVSGVLDRESASKHEFSVVLSTLKQSPKCTVTVHVLDVNDNPHIFNKDVYNVAVKEDAPIGTMLIRLSLTDPDEEKSALSFFISAGDDAMSFSVTQTMELTLVKGLDRETTSNYVLTVLATDGRFTSTTAVHVVVIDVNDEIQTCVYPLYNVTVSESQPPGHLVTSIITSDNDLESPLEYRLSGPGAERFTVDNHGEVRLKQFLDRETNPAYILEVKVVDAKHHDWFCISRVMVSVTDINDNSPSFAVINETVTLTEDASVGMIVTKVQVLDLDQGRNRQVSFFQVGPNHMFNLSSSTGLLTLAKPLQSSPGSVHSVTVGASDHGSPRLSAITTIQVIVVGMNDDPPAHVTAAFHVTVAEDAPVGTSLLHLRTLHGKGTKQTHILYTVLEGNGQAEFEIERTTGVLATAKPLDYETRPASHLLILATSVGETSMINYLSVNVSVLDVNDNPPVFKVTRYSMQIREDVEVGQMVLKVDAEDVDSGKNGIIKFSLDKESARKFTVDSSSGVLMVANSLDREQCAEYTVLVVAADQGSPALSSTATVNIDITDINDNPPLFNHPNSTAVLQADRMPGWAVFHFAVTDADQAFSSSHFTFRIISGNEKSMFRVDPDGTLRTTDRLSVTLGDVFQLQVQVDDGGSPNLFSSTWIYIKVVEPSKHPPVVSPLRVWVGVYENQWPGGDIGHVTATDLDPYDKLEYSVPASPQFSVDPRQGTLKARGSLAPGVHTVNVSVTDGKFASFSEATVTVQSLAQDMLQTSVYIRMFSKVKPDILVRKLPLFLSTLHSAFLRDVTLISLQDIPNSTIGMLIAVSGGADLQVVQEVMTSAGLSGSTPQCDCRNGGLCQRQLQMMPDRTNVFSASGLSFVTPGHSLTYYCICSMGYAGEHCEEIKCQCPPLQVCVPQRVGFSCMPPCSANQTCPAAMTSSISWPELITCGISIVAIVLTIVILIIYRRFKNSATDQEKYGSIGAHNFYMKKKTKLSNIEASQKPPIFTGSPNNGTMGRNNLDTSPSLTLDGETIPLDYVRNINPITSKIENDIIPGQTSAPDLATCHSVDSFASEDPARELAALDEQLSLDVVQYGFPSQRVSPVLAAELEVPL